MRRQILYFGLGFFFLKTTRATHNPPLKNNNLTQLCLCGPVVNLLSYCTLAVVRRSLYNTYIIILKTTGLSLASVREPNILGLRRCCAVGIYLRTARRSFSADSEAAVTYLKAKNIFKNAFFFPFRPSVVVIVISGRLVTVVCFRLISVTTSSSWSVRRPVPYLCIYTFMYIYNIILYCDRTSGQKCLWIRPRSKLETERTSHARPMINGRKLFFFRQIAAANKQFYRDELCRLN